MNIISVWIILLVIIIFLSIILAIWWPIKKVNSTSSVKDELQSTKQLLVCMILWVITGIYALALFPTFGAGVILFLGTGPFQWTAFLIIAGFPITMSVSAASAWVLYRGGKFGFALRIILIPIVHLAGYIWWSAR